MSARTFVFAEQPLPKHTCTFYESHPETLKPVGTACGKPATQELDWTDGEVSPACEEHGMQTLDDEARATVVRVRRPTQEDQWVTRD